MTKSINRILGELTVFHPDYDRVCLCLLPESKETPYLDDLGELHFADFRVDSGFDALPVKDCVQLNTLFKQAFFPSSRDPETPLDSPLRQIVDLAPLPLAGHSHVIGPIHSGGNPHSHVIFLEGGARKGIFYKTGGGDLEAKIARND